jgi:hypothetical protein
MDPESFERVLERTLEAELRSTEPRDGGAADFVDGWYDLIISDRHWTVALECKSSPGQAPDQIAARQGALQAKWPNVVTVLAVPRLSRREREMLRDKEVNFVDLSGNASIRGAGLVVDLEGVDRRADHAPRRSGRNPFSKKASLVARVLLAAPARDWRVRDISEEGSLSVGYTSEVLRSLVDRGYVAEKPEGFSLVDPVSLLREWSSAYRWEDNKVRSYVAPFGKEELTAKAIHALESAGARCLLALLSAMDRFVPYVQHDQLHVYVSKFANPAQQAVRGRLHAESVSRGGNLHIMEPYYGKAAWYGSVRQNAFECVSDVQLFLDLVHYPVRGPEAAEVLLRKHIAPRLGLSHEQARTLAEGVGL